MQSIALTYSTVCIIQYVLYLEWAEDLGGAELVVLGLQELAQGDLMG